MIIDKFGLRAVAAPLVCEGGPTSEGGHMTTLTCQIFILFYFFILSKYIYKYIYIYIYN